MKISAARKPFDRNAVSTAACALILAGISAASAQQNAREPRPLYRPPNAVAVLPALPTPEMRYLDYDVNYVMQLWEGEFDNREQLLFESEAGRRAADPGAHGRVHSTLKRIEAPRLGAHVLQVIEYRNNDPTAIAREQLYVLSADPERKAIRVARHSFRDRASGDKAATDSARLVNMSAADLVRFPQCDLFLRRVVDAFEGGTEPGSCQSGDTADREYRLRLQSDRFQFAAAPINGGANKGAAASTVAAAAWSPDGFVLERARLFSCMIDFPKQAGKPAMYTDRYIVAHDQGGTYFFTHPDGRPMVMTLRNNWSYGMYRETLVVVIQAGDESGETLAYGWTEPGADRIGINPSWMRVQCDLDTPQNRQAQQELRSGS